MCFLFFIWCCLYISNLWFISIPFVKRQLKKSVDLNYSAYHKCLLMCICYVLDIKAIIDVKNILFDTECVHYSGNMCNLWTKDWHVNCGICETLCTYVGDACITMTLGWNHPSSLHIFSPIIMSQYSEKCKSTKSPHQSRHCTHGSGPQIFQQSGRLIMNSLIEFSREHVEMLMNKFRKGWKNEFSLNWVDRFSFGIGFEIEVRLTEELDCCCLGYWCFGLLQTIVTRKKKNPQIFKRDRMYGSANWSTLAAAISAIERKNTTQR